MAREVARGLKEYGEADLRDWSGLDLTGTNDCTSILQAAAASTAGVIKVPLGTIVTSGQVDIGSSSKSQVWRGIGGARSTKFRCVGNVVHFLVAGEYSFLEDVLLDGLNAASVVAGGNNTGAVGVLLGSKTVAVSGEKLGVRNVSAQYFTQAGIVVAGAQNCILTNCRSKYNLRNFCITNGSRTIVLESCNSSDWDNENDTWVSQFMKESDPETRNVFIGLTTLGGLVTNQSVTWATTAGFAGKVPSNITLRKNIHERNRRSTYNIEIKEFYDVLDLDRVEITYASDAGALLRMDAWQGTANSPYRAQIIRRGMRLYRFSAEKAFSLGAGVIDGDHFADINMGEGAFNRPANVGDWNVSDHLLDAPGKFPGRDVAGSLGSWTAHSTGSASLTAGGRLRVNSTGTGNGARANYRQGQMGAITLPAGKLVKIHCVPTAVSGTTRLTHLLGTTPFVRTIGTIATTDVGKDMYFTYTTQGDEAVGTSGSILVGADAAATIVTDFAAFEVTVL
jgi:hypothetical protein